MTSVQIPPFTTTPVEQIPSIVSRLRSTFFSQKTRPAEFRIKQLRKLYWAIADHEKELLEALSRDLGKGSFEAYTGEINWTQNDIVFTTQNLEKWMKDEKPADIALSNRLVNPKIRKDPLGVVLVIGAFNFPVNLSFGPMIGAIAAGNTVVLKPSEQSPNSAAVMQKIIETALDPDCYACVQGAIPETSALLEQKWDKIFFTGSARTAKIIAQAAAKNLTPVALELGGRNPAIVTKKADMRLVARRLLWSKTMNAGQICISQNCILADREVVPTLIAELKAALKEFFPEGAKKSADYSRIVNLTAFNRIKKMLDNTSGRIVIGGTMDADQLFIEPTVIEVTDPKDSLLVEESFGPLIPILPVDNLDQAISIANELHETPLGVYAFGSKAETDKILTGTRSGGASINDGFFHGIIPNLPFGGVGDSGTGAYRGKASFDCFTHHRSVTYTPNWMESLLAVRYPPFAGTGKLAQFNKMGLLKPDFDRKGNRKIGAVWYLLTLGAGSVSGGAFRAALIAGICIALKAFMDGKVLTASK
ncbi:aldehyde dehydrogenase (NAD(P)+) [Cladophialophora psammophila CBS 110553]|uniref:Aldehyde dehydrogenase n=1 Tax=Cladophialophora psammophila CBS 110553 TaxID=1182543 RepID=W9WZB2_9EURO|nr:aldehyde dehydrogenase (NAD(P)+) [Cladophialophora psammophila CBS 110553]EXJ73293.1 aldehyde dehydrogenase (NAD(P)+) [Cladophialophora psammophila CBS 110553]